jgi:hypothetical protein
MLCFIRSSSSGTPHYHQAADELLRPKTADKEICGAHVQLAQGSEYILVESDLHQTRRITGYRRQDGITVLHGDRDVIVPS